MSSVVCVINVPWGEVMKSWGPAIDGDMHRVVALLIFVIIYSF